MPYLKAETSIFPPDLLSGFTEDPSDRRWWVLHTKPRQEKAVARILVKGKIPFFLPLVARDHVQRGVKVHSYVPIFSGYVFLFGTDEERISSLATNRLANVLPVESGEQLLADLCQVQRLVECNAPLTVERRIVSTQRVRIKTGPLEGTEGIVERRKGKTRLVVLVRFIQQGASVEMEDWMLEPIG